MLTALISQVIYDNESVLNFVYLNISMIIGLLCKVGQLLLEFAVSLYYASNEIV